MSNAYMRAGDFVTYVLKHWCMPDGCNQSHGEMFTMVLVMPGMNKTPVQEHDLALPEAPAPPAAEAASQPLPPSGDARGSLWWHIASACAGSCEFCRLGLTLGLYMCAHTATHCS